MGMVEQVRSWLPPGTKELDMPTEARPEDARTKKIFTTGATAVVFTLGGAIVASPLVWLTITIYRHIL